MLHIPFGNDNDYAEGSLLCQQTINLLKGFFDMVYCLNHGNKGVSGFKESCVVTPM